MSDPKAPMPARRRYRRRLTREKRRAKTYAFYREIAPGEREDPRYPWPRLALRQYRQGMPKPLQGWPDAYPPYTASLNGEKWP